MYAENDVPCTLLSLIGQANGLLFLAGQGDGTTDDLMIHTNSMVSEKAMFT